MIELPEKIRQRRQEVLGTVNSLNAAIALAQMDPHSREDLICYLRSLTQAQEAGDQDEQAYLIDAIAEVFSVVNDQSSPDLDSWTSQADQTVEGRQAKTRLAGENEAFVARYQQLKEQAGLKTIRDVATAADLSPTTVQAIESQRVKPQIRTLQALAKAFHVDVSEFLKAS